MAQADWASGVQLRRLLLVVVAEGGPAHDNQGSSIRYQDHSSSLHPSFRLRCFSYSSLSYFCLALLTLTHLSRVLLEGIGIDEDEHCRISIDILV